MRVPMFEMKVIKASLSVWVIRDSYVNKHVAIVCVHPTLLKKNNNNNKKI